MKTHESTTLKGVYLVPGLPQILQMTDRNESYKKLKQGFSEIKMQLDERGVKRIFYYSTHWLAVLGQLVQYRENLKGTHVDENWYEYGDLSFDMKVDRKFSKHLARVLESSGKRTRLVDYDGFPVDTGTIVADTLTNFGERSVAIMANHVYSDYAVTKGLGSLVRETIEQDQVPTAVVGIGSLSGRYFTESIDLREDHISQPSDDEWNRKILDLLKDRAYQEVESLLPEYSQKAKVEMGLKVFGFLSGLQKSDEVTGARVLAYGPVYGTGAAVVEL